MGSAHVSAASIPPQKGEQLHFIDHWLIQDFYDPVWPNIAASMVVGIWVVSRVKLHLKRHKKWLSQHLQHIHGRLHVLGQGKADE